MEAFLIHVLRFVGNLFESSGNIKSWIKFKADLLEPKQYQWIQSINALARSWKKSIKDGKANLIVLSVYVKHLIN